MIQGLELGCRSRRGKVSSKPTRPIFSPSPFLPTKKNQHNFYQQNIQLLSTMSDQPAFVATFKLYGKPHFAAGDTVPEASRKLLNSIAKKCSVNRLENSTTPILTGDQVLDSTYNKKSRRQCCAAMELIAIYNAFIVASTDPKKPGFTPPHRLEYPKIPDYPVYTTHTKRKMDVPKSESVKSKKLQKKPGIPEIEGCSPVIVAGPYLGETEIQTDWIRISQCPSIPRAVPQGIGMMKRNSTGICVYVPKKNIIKIQIAQDVINDAVCFDSKSYPSMVKIGGKIYRK